MSRYPTRGVLAITLILIAVALLVLNQGGYLQPAQSLVLRPIAGFQTWLSVRASAVRDLLTSPGDIETLRQQIADLESENAALKQEMIALRERAAETEILAALVDFARSQPESHYLAANVVGRDISPFLKWILIGAGSDDGLQRGMPVVTERGLVGRVVDVFATISRVQLITDPEAAVNVKLQESRADGILVPQLNGDLQVQFLDQSATIELGELVLTSGLGGTMPADISIGKVISVRKRDFELFQEATIEPDVDFDELEIVLVITSFIPIELPEESP